MLFRGGTTYAATATAVSMSGARVEGLLMQTSLAKFSQDASGKVLITEGRYDVLLQKRA
jgi:hypothetical protein